MSERELRAVIVARSDARFDGRDFDGLGRAEKQRYLDRAAAGIAALSSTGEAEGWLRNFVSESNNIEGIYRDPTIRELDAHAALLSLPMVMIGDLSAFVEACQPGNVLRDRPGLNVRVGNYIAPDGGPLIPRQLDDLLTALPCSTPRENHVKYETLHPFTDGNGRSGRALWLWQHLNLPGGTPDRAKNLGFLHTYYYETLAESRPAPKRKEGEGNG